MKLKNRILALVILVCFIGCNTFVFADEFEYPNYANEYLGFDKHENYNRKMFNFDRGLNKYVIRPIHIIWASIVPQYVMDRILGISNNIEYPIRLVSSLIQRDWHNAGNDTKRFLVNTTIGLAGMFDPAKHMLKIYSCRDNMDKALSRCHIKPGTYFVAPVIVFTTPRDIVGRILDVALNPTSYIGTPILAIVKAGMMINRTSYWQSLIYIVESTYADPYEITKIAFGIDKFIKMNNFDRVNILSELRVSPEEEAKLVKENDTELEVSAKIVSDVDGKIDKDKILEVQLGLDKVSIEPNIILPNYCPQSPVVDSMRTMLLVAPDVTKSMWNEMSPWNKSFYNRIKTGSVNLADGRPDYNYKYLLQKDKNAPLVIIYPSTGDGVNAINPIMFAKMFYDVGYSIVIHGNPFQWEYVRSMPKDYYPGLPLRDSMALRESTIKIINNLELKTKQEFKNKVLFGTSLAALDIMFIADAESKDNKLGNVQFISICPPIDLMYALKQVDKYSEEWKNFPQDLKDKVAYASAKLVNFFQNKSEIDFLVNKMPFDEDEAKLITSFIMHQKLTDVIFVIENSPTNKYSGIYDKICKIGFEDYFNKYIKSNTEVVEKEIERGFGLVAISDYLITAKNYKIYHSKNDYLINRVQLKQLKQLAGDNLVILDNGSHMGFTYRPEFQTDLRKTIINMKNML